MGIEKFQNDETKEVSKNTSSFEEIRQKVIKLNNEEYKGRTYNVGIRSSLGFPIPYVGVKNKKIKLQSEQPQYIKASEKDDFYTSVGVGYGKMSKKEKERFESDKQEMSQLISNLSDLYGLNQLISDLNVLYGHSPYVNEENGKVVISFAQNVRFEHNVQIICDGEKAVLRKDGKEEKEFRLRTPKEINEGKMINSQKMIKKHDEAQKNEGDLAEQQINDALKGLE